jgi:streptogramin lyase
MAVSAGSVWIGESLAGLYRIDPAQNRVVARLQIGPRAGRLVPTRLLAAPGGALFAVAVRTKGGALTPRNALARIDPRRNRVEGVTALRPGPLLVATGAGSLWIARRNGSGVERIDPSNGRVIAHLDAKVGMALALAGGRIWTIERAGTIRSLGRP